AEVVRQAIESTAAKWTSQQLDSLERLEQARQRIAEARVEQAEAQGSHDEATSERQRLHRGELQLSQDAANRPLEEWAAGSANNPLDAAYQQQLVADGAQEL